MTQQEQKAKQAHLISPLLLALLGSLCLTGNTTFADYDEIEETLVTATRTEKSQNELLVSTLVISREDIARSGASDLAELLQFHAGLDIGRNGGPGQTTSVFIRGTESNHTLVLIDGVEMNPGTIGGAAIQNINPDIIERIEIVKGPRSSLYGSEALGGVINVITRKAHRSSINTNLTYGSDDNKQISAHSAFREDDRFASFTLAWKDTDGFPSLREQTADRGHDSLSMNFRGGLNLFNQAIELTHWQASGNTEYYGFDTASFDTGPLDQNFNNRVTTLSVSSDISEQWQSKILLGHSNDLIEQNQYDFFFFQEPLKDMVETDRLTLDWQNTYKIKNNQIIAGAYFEREDTDSLSFGSIYSDPTESKAIYVGTDSQFAGFDTLIAARYTDNETAGGQVSWNADLAYTVSPTLRAGITSGRAFRAPDATDRYGFGGNPNLDTEESTSVSAVLNWKSPYGDLNLELFQTQIDNLIETVIVDPDNFIFQNINIAETEIKGLELSHKIIINDWSIESAAVVQSPKDKSDNSYLLRRARRSLSTHIQKDFDKINLGLQVLASSDRPDVDAVTFAEVTTAGYVLANLTGSYDINENASVFAEIDNLTDVNYETAAGYEQSGRKFQLSLRLKY